MWYFAWILGLGFAVLLAVVSAVWVEFEDSRRDGFNHPDDDQKITLTSSVKDKLNWHNFGFDGRLAKN